MQPYLFQRGGAMVTGRGARPTQVSVGKTLQNTAISKSFKRKGKKGVKVVFLILQIYCMRGNHVLLPLTLRHSQHTRYLSESWCHFV